MAAFSSPSPSFPLLSLPPSRPSSPNRPRSLRLDAVADDPARVSTSVQKTEVSPAADGGENVKRVNGLSVLYDDGYGTVSVKDYFAAMKEIVKFDRGPPRWFCPVECGQPIKDAPVLFYLPGIGGTGMGLIMHHKSLGNYKGISHYEADAEIHTALPCPGELLVEEHHSNYGEPWAGGRDVFEFLASAVNLSPSDRVLEIGCGTLRVGLHFIRYLDPSRFHCLERDDISLMAALRYELPSQGLLHKRPVILKGDDMDFSRFGDGIKYDLIYASAVFLHMPGELVWKGLERLVEKLNPAKGRIYASHNMKFCTRLREECPKRLAKIGLEFVGNRTHDSLLFNHYEIWYEFRRIKS